MKKFLLPLLLAITACATSSPVAKKAPVFPPGVSLSKVETNTVVTSEAILNATQTHKTGIPGLVYHISCVGDCGGTGGWDAIAVNTVSTQGRNDLLDKYFKGSTYTAAWYLIPKGTGSMVVGDTYASHAGWSEITAYSAGTRPSVTWGTTSAGSNTATQVSYSINGSATIQGACLLYGSSTKGDTAAGGAILYSCADFSTSRTVASGDTLNVTPTVSD